MLHGPMTLGMHMFVQLRSLFRGEFKTTKQKIINVNVTEDLFMKEKMIENYKHYNCEKYKKCLTCYKASYIFAHAPYNKN